MEPELPRRRETGNNQIIPFSLLMPFDNLCKYLSEKYPDRFAAWLLGPPPAGPVQVLKTELSIEPIRADYVTFLSTQERILHLEFQVKVVTDPPLPLRMLDYWVRLHRRYRLPVTQVLVLLRPPSEATAIETEFRLEGTRHEDRVVRLWELDPQLFLTDPALLPLATLAATSSPEQLLGQVAQQVSLIESPDKRREISTIAQMLAGLRFRSAFIRQFFKEGVMRESVIYQEILLEGELAIVLRQLNRRIGAFSPELRAKIQALSPAQLEDLGEALLDFSSAADLAAWLQAH